jgi:hypothetical protein
LSSGAIRANSVYQRALCSAGPLMISGLVDQDRVDLVDDRVVVAALDQVVPAPRHVVAQVVEPELVVRAVRDVAEVLLAALGRGLARQDRADRDAEEPVHPAHPLGVALGEVVVGGDDVHAVTGERVEVRGQDAGQGLALAGAHLRHVPEVQRGAAHELHAVVLLPQRAGRGLADDGERLRQQRVEALAVCVALLELVGLRPQIGVAQRGGLLVERLDRVGDLRQSPEDASFTGPQDLR